MSRWVLLAIKILASTVVIFSVVGVIVYVINDEPKDHPVTFTAKNIEVFLENCGFGSCTRHLVVSTDGKVYRFYDESWALIEPNHQYTCTAKEYLRRGADFTWIVGCNATTT